MKETPKYYIGKKHKIHAIDVIEDFELSYNVGNAVSYLLRCGKKTSDPTEDIQKAIHHLQHELNWLSEKVDISSRHDKVVGYPTYECNRCGKKNLLGIICECGYLENDKDLRK